MAVFAYKAVETNHHAVAGTITADTPRQARDQLRHRGLILQDLQPVGEGSHGAVGRWWTRLRSMGQVRRRRGQVTAFVRELSTLLGVGIPLLEGIETIAEQHRGWFHTSLAQIRDRVASGLSLAEAMRQQPYVFDELTVSITEVGESAGTLDEVLEQLARYQEQALQFRNRVASALIYPAIVLSVGVAVSVFLMTFVVPNLLDTLIEAGRPLPLLTRIVKGASDLLIERWWIILASLLVIVLAVACVLRTSRGGMAWHRLQLRLPISGPLLCKQATMRIAMVISTLMRTGIPFVRAVQIARKTTTNRVMQNALLGCEHAVGAGQDIGAALKQTGAFPATVVQIFAVGQQSGRLEDMLTRLAADYDQQIALATGRLTAVLEPILIVALAILVGCIAFATILPILEAGHVV